MRNRSFFPTIVVLLSLFVGLGLVSHASASQPIPGIKKTAQWRSLLSYVDVLEGKKNTPATPAQKSSFRNRLNTKQAAANARVKTLYNQRINKITALDAVRERSQIKKVRQSQAKAVAELNASLSARLAVAADAYSDAVRKVKDRFSFRLSSEQANLRKLRKNLSRTTNPFQRQLILQRIDVVTNEIKQQKKAQKKSIDKQTSIYQSKTAFINERYAERIASTKKFYKAQVRKIQTLWKVIYADDVAKIKSQRAKEFTLVTRLRNRGNGYIERMPMPPN
jgi:hypothetical protein